MSRLKTFLQRLKATAPRVTWRRLVAIGTVAIVAVATYAIVKPIGGPQTLGSIWVDGPDVYTRERLVNDRFVQDAWLNKQLQKSDSVRDPTQVIEERRQLQVRAMAGAQPNLPELPAKESRKADSDRPPPPEAASQIQLMVENDFRDVVRHMIIENQLDDRHDMHGNSLYMLKFNATVMPGDNTQASAHVRVRLKGPPLLTGKAASGESLADTQAEIDAWRHVYRRWIDSLRARLNQAHTELKVAYRNNEFSHNDYAKLITFASRHLHQPPVGGRCAAPFTSPMGAYSDPSRLRQGEHDARKSCLVSIVRARQADDASVQEELNGILNKYFASKTMQLVLGTVVPETPVGDDEYLFDVPGLQQLVEVSFPRFNPRANEGSEFDVLEKSFSVTAINPDRLASSDSFKQVADDSRALLSRQYSDYVRPKFQTKRKLLVSATDLANIDSADYPFRDADFNATEVDGLYTATAQVGLFNFMKKAKRNVRTFTYSVYPKERGDTVAASFGVDAALSGATPDKILPSTSALYGRESSGQSMQRRGIVIGFGKSTGDDVAEFGWMVNARNPGVDGTRMVYRQTAAQHSLSALVSIPAWWNEVELTVTTSWIGADGKPIRDTEEVVKYSVNIPVDFEPLELSLMEVQQLRPELMESRLDPIRLTACQDGAIVIPGRRLWRSTKVTLGYQSADEITVLPDMKGIVARFRPVRNQTSLTEMKQKAGTTDPLEIRRSVRVWTSQGAITLPSQASIGIPAKCEAEVIK